MKRLWKLLGQLFGIALLLNIMIELLSRKSLPMLGAYMFGSPLVFLLNTLLILTPFLLAFLTKRKVFVTTVLTVVVLVAGMANGVLLVFRTTPFTAADLRLVKYATSLLTTYLNWWQIVLGIILLVLAICGCVWVWRHAPVESAPVVWKEAVCVVAVATTVIWGSLTICILSGVVAVQFGNIGQAYQDYGFAYCFSNSLFNTGIAKPEVYDKEVVAEIEEEDLVPSNAYAWKQKDPNIIMLQLESFFDPVLWEGNPETKDPIPFFRFLKGAYPSGYLSVPSVGAGTANTEFECITGMNLDFFGPGEYPYKTVLQKTVCESMAFNMKSLGYRTHAIHNNEGTFYDRYKVFSQLGFDTFTPIEYMEDTERTPTGWCKDNVLIEEVTKALDSTLDPDYVYTISVQGHGKYPSFEYYLEQLAQMDEVIKQLIISLNKRREPTILVLYGDHLPGFEWSAEEMANKSLFQTEYVVWNNMNLPGEKKDLEAYQLSSHVLNLLNVHEGTMIRFHQRWLREGKEEFREDYLAAMKILEYDILYGDREVYGGSSPYKATRMEMGNTAIIQRTTVHIGEQIIVFGENFNEYSKICVNGKAVDTPYIRENRLIATGISYKEGEEITVQQIGRDKIPLGTARKGPGA